MDLHQLTWSLRFVQGYRFLDKCGEAVIQLEDILGEGWIPSELSPKAGTMVNHAMGMNIQFSSELLGASQSEFLDFDYFVDQVCKTYDILRPLFKIKAINAPSLLVTYQKGFDDLSQSDAYINGLQITRPANRIVAAMAGSLTSSTYTVCAETTVTWDGAPVVQRTRFEAKSVIQERQAAFDDRLLQRARLLSDKQRDAMKALAALRRRQPNIAPTAAQFSAEYAFETELLIERFDLYQFLQQAWQWTQSMQSSIEE